VCVGVGFFYFIDFFFLIYFLNFKDLKICKANPQMFLAKYFLFPYAFLQVLIFHASLSLAKKCLHFCRLVVCFFKLNYRQQILC